jgi:hypothetical protein
MEERQQPDALKALEHMLQLSCKEGQINPAHAIGRTGDHLDVIAFLSVPPDQLRKACVQKIIFGGYDEFLFGLDRHSKPNQGVDEKYDSVYTIFHTIPATKDLKVGVFPYNKAGEYGEIDWNNEFWKQHCESEFLSGLKDLYAESLETFYKKEDNP